MKNNKKGFTLVELVIVVAVMAILVAVAIPTVASITGKATAAVNESNAQTIESMIKLEMAETNATTLSEEKVAQAIVDAKLGITDGKFVYNVKSGAVTVADKEAGSADAYLITFDKTKEEVTVKGTATKTLSLEATAATEAK